MKLIFFTKYSRKGASSRLRSLQYIPLYEKQGHKCTIEPLFNDKYLDRIYSKQSRKTLLIFAYLKRLISIRKMFLNHVVIIEKELFPYFPAFFEWLLYKLNINYVVDYDDAIFHNYDLSRNYLVRFFLKRKIDKVMFFAHHVVAGNEYLAERARKAGAKNVTVIPTVVDLEKYSVKEFKDQNKIIIGWIGTPFTSKYLLLIKEALQRLSLNHPIKLKLVGVKDGIGLNEIEEFCTWSEAAEVDLIKSFDIGIMPLQDSEWERGKCGYKLIQYMACGIPVIASAVGVNKELVNEGSNGFKAATVSEWEEKIKRLISAPQLRYVMGMNGRKMIESHYNLDIQFKNWLGIINLQFN